MNEIRPPQIVFGPRITYSGWRLGVLFVALQVLVLIPFWVNAARIPAGTYIRPMALAAWLLGIGAAGFMAVPVSLYDLRRAWNIGDHHGVWKSVGGVVLGITALPGALALFYAIVALNGLILAD